MLDITACQDYFETVKAFATGRGLIEQLQQRLDYLDTYANGKGCMYASTDKSGTRCRLFKDFAPNSFEFLMEYRSADGYEKWFNGGLIFFDSGETGVDAPQLSVRVTSDLSAGWSIHT